jgi:hypothetical protein
MDSFIPLRAQTILRGIAPAIQQLKYFGLGFLLHHNIHNVERGNMCTRVPGIYSRQLIGLSD